MGSELSCDRCGVVLPQGEPESSPLVYEKRGADAVHHLCTPCFREHDDKGYTLRTVYACVGEENARQFAAAQRSA